MIRQQQRYIMEPRAIVVYSIVDTHARTVDGVPVEVARERTMESAVARVAQLNKHNLEVCRANYLAS